MVQEATSEAHLPAQRSQAGEAPRVPSPDVDQSRPRHHQVAAGQGPQPPLGLIRRIGDRATFVELRRRGLRRRRGEIMVTALVGGDGPPRVAFAVGRGVGGAVVRNRVRRRLRSAITELEAEGEGLAGGAYLVAAAPDAAAAPYAQLRDDLRRTLAAAGALVRP